MIALGDRIEAEASVVRRYVFRDSVREHFLMRIDQPKKSE
jgi:hypothetical protein